MEEQAIIRIWHLFALINQLSQSKSAGFVIQVPYFKKPLFSASIKESHTTLRCHYEHSSYKKEWDNAERAKLGKEVPDYHRLKDAMLQSGVIDYPNLSQLLLEIHSLCERDFMEGDRPVYLGLDTNLFRDRFYSAQYDWLAALPHNKIGVSISPYVRYELDFSWKYKDHQINRLREHCVQPQFKKYFHEFFNQNCFEDRLKRLGFVEIEKARRLHWIILLPELDEEQLQPNPDMNIILNYKIAVQNRNVDIFLLSRDSDFIALAGGISGIQPFFVETPSIHTLNSTISHPYKLVQLLYILAVQFGMIEVTNEEIRILLLGIWRGKTPQDWKRECLKLILPEMSTPAIQLWRNIEILQEMKWQFEY